jgi:PAS domain S-box-containing protein
MNPDELNQYWKTVVDTIQDGVMIVSPEGIIVAVNRAFEEMTGHSRSQIIGRPCSVINCSNCEIARKTSGPYWCGMFRKGFLKRQRCTIQSKDGRTVHVLKNASVIRNQHGTVTGAVETMTDITDLLDKETQIESFRRELNAEDRYFGMIGTSAPMQQLFHLIANAAQSDAPVIIFGESGTGKEMVAKAIHEAGSRAGQAYLKVNCAALNEALLESELFGHVKGAFTGAHRDREGRFQAAHGGDIFLDEIGDLPLSIQIKLLRVLEEKVVERVGDNEPIAVDVRIISATNRNLEELIAKGKFREDFYYRINVIPIQVSPLRAHREDIALLARTFFNRMALKSSKKIDGISPPAMALLSNYAWPGNVRELQSAFEFAFVACPGGMIEACHLPAAILKQTADDCPPPAAPERLSLDEIKRRRLLDALRRTGGNQSQAAALLGISRTSVWNQIKKYKIDRP